MAPDNNVRTYHKLRVDESQNMCKIEGVGVGGKGIGKGSHDRYVGKSGIEGLGLSGSGGLGMVGVGGSGVVESSGIGGIELSGVGGEAVTEGHVGRIVSRFEIMTLMQLHGHGSSAEIIGGDRQSDDDHDRQQRQQNIDLNLKQTTTTDDEDIERRPTTNDHDDNDSKQPSTLSSQSPASCVAKEPQPKALVSRARGNLPPLRRRSD